MWDLPRPEVKPRPRIGRLILNNWTTREVQGDYLKWSIYRDCKQPVSPFLVTFGHKLALYLQGPACVLLSWPGCKKKCCTLFQSLWCRAQLKGRTPDFCLDVHLWMVLNYHRKYLDEWHYVTIMLYTYNIVAQRILVVRERLPPWATLQHKGFGLKTLGAKLPSWEVEQVNWRAFVLSRGFWKVRGMGEVLTLLFHPLNKWWANIKEQQLQADPLDLILAKFYKYGSFVTFKMLLIPEAWIKKIFYYTTSTFEFNGNVIRIFIVLISRKYISFPLWLVYSCFLQNNLWHLQVDSTSFNWRPLSTCWAAWWWSTAPDFRRLLA